MSIIVKPNPLPTSTLAVCSVGYIVKFKGSDVHWMVVQENFEAQTTVFQLGGSIGPRLIKMAGHTSCSIVSETVTIHICSQGDLI